MFSSRPGGYVDPDVTSNAYLRTNSSYTDFLESREKQPFGGSPRQHSERMLDRRNSWRNESFTSPESYDLRTDHKVVGWRNEPSWRTPQTCHNGPPKNESWIGRRERIAPPVGKVLESQRHIAQTVGEPRQQIAPLVEPNVGFHQEIWRRSPSPTNWRKGSVRSATLRPPHELLKKGNSYDNTRNKNEYSYEHQRSPIIGRNYAEHSSHSMPQDLTNYSPRNPLSPSPSPSMNRSLERERPNSPGSIRSFGGRTPAMDITVEARGPKRLLERNPGIHSPIINKISPAEDNFERSQPDFSTNAEKNDKDSSCSSSTGIHGEEAYSDSLKPNWNVKRYREESWMNQYKRRVEAQKAEALLRNIERQKLHDLPPGPSYETYIQPEFGEKKARSRNEGKTSRENCPNQMNNMRREGSSPAIRKFFFADQSAQTSDSKNFDDHKHGGGYSGGDSQHHERTKPQQESYENYTNSQKHEFTHSGKPSVTRQNEEQRSDSHSTINPNDFVEEFSDDDWNELGALVNDQSKKRYQSPPDSNIPSKRAYRGPSAYRTECTYPGPSVRKEPSQPALSFFRREIPSARSAKGFSGCTSDQSKDYEQHHGNGNHYPLNHVNNDWQKQYGYGYH